MSDDGGRMADGNGISATGLTALFTSHDGRLQRLEDDNVSMTAAIAKYGSDLKSVVLQLESVSQNICDRLELIDKHLGEKLDTVSDNLKDIDSRLDVSSEKIKQLEVTENQRQESKRNWADVWKKVLIYFLTSGTAAVAAYLFERMRNH